MVKLKLVIFPGSACDFVENQITNGMLNAALHQIRPKPIHAREFNRKLRNNMTIYPINQLSFVKIKTQL